MIISDEIDPFFFSVVGCLLYVGHAKNTLVGPVSHFKVPICKCMFTASLCGGGIEPGYLLLIFESVQ